MKELMEKTQMSHGNLFKLSEASEKSLRDLYDYFVLSDDDEDEDDEKE